MVAEWSAEILKGLETQIRQGILAGRDITTGQLEKVHHSEVDPPDGIRYGSCWPQMRHDTCLYGGRSFDSGYRD